MADRASRYPLLRRKRRGASIRPARRLGARGVRIIAVLALLALVLGTIVVLARRAAAPDPSGEYAAGIAALKRGNYSAARNHALIATTGADTGPANVLLARVSLLMGRGDAAEGALNRAVAAGVPIGRLRQLFAESYLMQGDADRALAEAARVAPDFAADADRVRARALAAKGDVPQAVAILERASGRAADNSAIHGDLGRIRFDAGDVSGADVAVRRALAIDPANLDAIVLAGEVVRSRYGLRAALPWFARALERDAYHYPALIEYAATAGDLGQVGVMLEASRRALAARPDSPHALYLQAVLAARAGRYELARTLLARVGDAGLNMPGAVLLTGLIAYAQGGYEQAVVSFREVVGRQPMNLVARRLLGASLLRSGDARGALEALRPMGVRADADSYTLTLVGRAFEATGERDWAARFLDRAARAGVSDPTPFASDDVPAVLANAVAKQPNDPALAVSYVRSLLDAGDGPAARQRAVAIASASPGAPEAQLLAGDALAATGQYGAALARYRQAADLRFDTPVLLRLMEAAERAGQRKQGAEALALFLSQNPQSVTARRLLANLQLAARDWEAAADTLEGVRAAVGNRDALLLAQLGHAYTGAGDPATGLVYARAGYALAPMTSATADAYGWALYERGEPAAALPLLGKAAELSPGHAGIRWHRAQALAELGRSAEARAEIATALRDPAFPDRQPALALLKALGR